MNRRHMTRIRHKGEQGFALAAVLWLVAGLTIVVAMVGDAAVSAKQRVAQLRERTEFRQASISARSQVLYRLAVSRPTSVGWTDGITTIRGDDTLYQLMGGNILQLQDVGGLLNLNAAPRDLISGFLVNCGISTEEVDHLIDALEDYIDSDHLSRINGAERDTYVWAGKPEPRNSPLLSVPELWSVWGWDRHRATLESRHCTPAMVALPASGVGLSRLNFATAPPLLLEAAGLGSETVNEMMSARSDAESVARRTVPETAGAGPFSGAVFSLRTFRVRHRHPTGPWLLEYTVTLDVDGLDRPWYVTHTHTPAKSDPQEAGAKIAPLPWPTEPPAVTQNDVAQFFQL